MSYLITRTIGYELSGNLWIFSFKIINFVDFWPSKYVFLVQVFWIEFGKLLNNFRTTIDWLPLQRLVEGKFCYHFRFKIIFWLKIKNLSPKNNWKIQIVAIFMRFIHSLEVTTVSFKKFGCFSFKSQKKSEAFPDFREFRVCRRWRWSWFHVHVVISIRGWPLGSRSLLSRILLQLDVVCSPSA